MPLGPQSALGARDKEKETSDFPAWSRTIPRELRAILKVSDRFVPSRGGDVPMAEHEPLVGAISKVRCTYRNPEDDFFCLRYQVWYPSGDCAFRTKFKTSPGCLDCEQGRFNLKRHAVALQGVRFHLPIEE